MNDYIRRFAEHGLSVICNRHAPRRVGAFHYVAQVAPALAGSESIAPMISIELFSRIR